jgi:hypothetical protein
MPCDETLVLWFVGSDEFDGEQLWVSPAVVKIAQARRWLRMRAFSGFIGASPYARHVPPQNPVLFAKRQARAAWSRNTCAKLVGKSGAKICKEVHANAGHEHPL